MNGTNKTALIIGKKYKIINAYDTFIYIKSEYGQCNHKFEINNLQEFFKLPNNSIYKKALKHFGIDNQLLKCVEEMAKLQQAIIKCHLYNMGITNNLTEELVDVEIMIKQIKSHLKKSILDTELYDRIKKEKLKKLKKLINYEKFRHPLHGF